MTEHKHYPVLLKESVELLNIRAAGLYIDGTFGRGGHTRAILNRLDAGGRVIAFDKDPDAIAYGRQNVEDSRLTLVHGSFSGLKKYLADNGIGAVDGIILDLGVSSPQLETPERGFSFRFDHELDMRMDNSSGQSAGDWINTAAETEIADVLWRFGEEKFSRRIARGIVKAREAGAIVTTLQLADVIRANVPGYEKGQNPATRCFQAIRIFINSELDDLGTALEDFPGCLNSGGRMVVISFHSLEDRMVKLRFNSLAAQEEIPKWVYAQAKEPDYKVIAKKVRAGLNEIEENSRSRSAVLRCLEKL